MARWRRSLAPRTYLIKKEGFGMRFKLLIKKGLIYCLIAMLTFGYPTIALDRSVAALDDTTASTTDTTTSPTITPDSSTVTSTSTSPATPALVDATPATDSTSTIPVTEAPAATPLVQDATLSPTTSNVIDPAAALASPTIVTQSVAPTPPATTTTNTIGNTITSTGQSGDASVIENTTAGNATSGNALGTATVLNNINSSTGGGGMVSFVSNVTGNVTGDIQLYPMIVGALSSGGVIASPTAVPSVASTTNNQITNNITLNAASGAATVSANTTAGNATTGNADTVANIMNIINSIISTNQSFVGVINIYGNLNGDILIAPDFIPQLLASNSASPGGSTATNVIDNTQIINNINLNATSGLASVSGNTTAGNAITGSALTNLVLINLSGHQVIASNSLLVFVNVLGKWVGVIVDAPAGSTAAAIGSGVTQNTASVLLPTVSPTTNSTIINNVTLNSRTGNARVTDNTTAGNATSGNATASANILNMTQSNFGLSGWFGVLFINVFGSWLGSFGIDTGNGTIPLPTDSPAVSQAPGAVRTAAVKPTPKPAVIQINSPIAFSGQSTSSDSPVDDTVAMPSVLGAQITPNISASQPYNYTLASFIALAILALLAIVVRRIWMLIAARRNLV